MSDIVISNFLLYNEKELLVPALDIKYIETDTDAEWTINCGGTRAYFIRTGSSLVDSIDDQAADSHFMANRLTTALFLSGCGLFRTKAVGRVYLKDIPLSEINITTHVDLWNKPKEKRKDEQINKDFSDWYLFICSNLLFRRAAEDAYFALLNPVEVDFFLYRGMEWLLKAADIGWHDLAKDMGVSVKEIKEFKKMINNDVGQRHGIKSGKKRRAIVSEYGSLIADYIYGLCNVRRRIDENFEGITPEKAANIVMAAVPLVPYP